MFTTILQLVDDKFATSQCQSPTSRHVKMLGCGKFLSVGGVVQHVHSRCPRSGVWHLHGEVQHVHERSEDVFISFFCVDMSVDLCGHRDRDRRHTGAFVSSGLSIEQLNVMTCGWNVGQARSQAGHRVWTNSFPLLKGPLLADVV